MELRNRLVMATQMWKEATAEPLPRMAPGQPGEQLEAFELKLIDMLCAQATAETARDVADKTSGRTRIRSSGAWSSATRRLPGSRHEVAEPSSRLCSR
jgi:hypothetical protein